MGKNKLGICLIGCGRAGMIHGRNFMNKVPGARITAVADASEEMARTAADELGADAWHTDYREILNDRTVDAVVVACPTNLHRDIVVDCANAKKHIFCEKPMAMNIRECDEMIEACVKNNVKLQIGFMRRFDPGFIEAKKLLDSGAIGELVQLHSCTRGPSKPRPWMYDLNKSNGILAEINSHDLDSIRWFAGSEVKELYAIGGNFRNPEAAEEYPDYYDSVLINGVFENGVQFCIDGAAYVQYGYDSKMEIIGTKGKIQVGRSEANSIRCTTPENGTCIQFIDSWMTLFADAYLAEDISFVEAILNDTQPAVTGKDGREAVKLVEMGNLSIKTKNIVRL